MHNSETEEGSEEEEDEEEEDICEEEEEEEEDESEEEEVNGGGGGGSDRVDLGVQTSLLESPSPTVSPPSTHTQRFRGQSYGSSPTSGPPYSSTPTYPMSSYLRHRMNSNSSLGEALATLPSPPTPSNKSKTPDSPASLTTQATPQRGGGGGYHRHNTSSGANDSLSTGSKLISTFIIAAAAVFFLILAWKYFSLVPSTGVKSIPICGAGGVPHVDCVPHRELNDTVSLYKKLMALLPAPEGCSKDEEGSLSTTEVVNSLVDFKPKVDQTSVENLLRNLVLLLKQHPDWGVAVSETETWEGTTLSVVTRPQTWLCWASELSTMMWAFVLSVAGWIFAALLLLLVLWAVYVLYRRTVVRREREKREAFALVEQATDILFRQHQMVGREGKGGHSFLAIDHIRDQLIPPQERSDKAEVWSKAVAYIRTHESRVREDVQHIFGEEFRVWQWLPDLACGPPPRTRSPGSPSSSPRSPVRAPSMGSPQTPATPQNQWPHVPTTTVPGWQGEAFTHNKQVGAPLAPPTSCLKVRHMFDAQHQSPGWVNEVREEILRRCAQAKILHIAVDTQSEEGTVYIKTLSTEEAGKVFGCLHGQWYRGQLVTAKYLRLERYHERFPDSKNSFVPMRPSN